MNIGWDISDQQRHKTERKHCYKWSRYS